MKIIATFSDGTEVRRDTTLKLTHAWQAKGSCVAHDPATGRYEFMHTGFAGSQALAQRAANSVDGRNYGKTFNPHKRRYVADQKKDLRLETEVVEVQS